VAIVVEASSEALVCGDSARLRVCSSNLLSNALKYAPAGSRVALTASVTETSQTGSTVKVSVSDAGHGVPAEFRERIFDKFFRVEHHRPGSDEGTRGVGIGLYLCRQIVVLHGGSIRCEEGGGGGGTRTTFDLPDHRVVAVTGREGWRSRLAPDNIFVFVLDQSEAASAPSASAPPASAPSASAPSASAPPSGGKGGHAAPLQNLFVLDDAFRGQQ
jgi:hypothetical protein